MSAFSSTRTIRLRRTVGWLFAADAALKLTVQVATTMSRTGDES